MEFRDLVQRLAEVLANPVVIGADGTARVSPELDALHRDVAAALESGGAGHAHALREIAAALDLLRSTAAEPAASTGFPAGPAEPEPPIFDAIEVGDVEVVRAALRDCDVNLRHGKYLATPLYRAMSCMHGASLEVIDLLLDAGADPRKGLTQTNVLHGLGFANWRGVRPEDLARVITRCVTLGAELEERSEKLGWTPLILAVSECNPVATEALLLAGADIHARAAEVEGVCFSGADIVAFAEGHPETLAVLQLYAARQ